MLLVGSDTGNLAVWKISADLTWVKLAEVASHHSHSLSVKRIRFNLRFSQPNENRFTVATCGSDQTVRIYRINL